MLKGDLVERFLEMSSEERLRTIEGLANARRRALAALRSKPKNKPKPKTKTKPKAKPKLKQKKTKQKQIALPDNLSAEDASALLEKLNKKLEGK